MKKLTKKDAWNKQGIAGLQGMVKSAQKAETLVGEKGLGECEDGEGGTSGGARKEVLKPFLEKESNI